MKPSSCIVLRPVCFLILLMMVVLSLSSLLIPLWIKRVASIENEVKFIAQNTNQEFVSQIQRASTLFSQFNTSTFNLVRMLSSYLDVDNLHFSDIESKVAFSLFQSLSTIPYLSQIAYIGSDGLLFAYYFEHDRLFTLYSNSTFSSTQNYTWYTQPANPDTGKLYGNAVESPPFDLVNSTWFQESINSSNGYVSVGTGSGPSQDTLFLSTVGTDGKKGAISLGFSMRFIINFLANETAFYNGSLYLATADGNVLSQGSIPNTRIVLADNRVSFQLLGDEKVISVVGNVTCRSSEGVFGYGYDSVLSIWSRKYVVTCSPFEISGLKMVYVLAVPKNEFLSLVHKNVRLAFIMLVLMISATVIIICSFVYLAVQAAKREMYLCGALINQMESTRQSERKSMNKSLAFASASHDIRASLAGITGLIEMCRDEVSKNEPLQSEMLSSLQQMKACTKDLLGILNSILDTSKIESGKMQLEEEEFDIEKLLEDTVDLFHPVGMKKGVDVILDPCDGSVMKSSCVKGDRGKLKQILSNLLSNAVKFTSDGHVVVRTWARKPSLRNASDRYNSMSNIFCSLFKIEKMYNDSDVMSIQQDPNRLEFVFEVIDTGKGIPKEKQRSVFENYVQVKETGLGHEGTGLGLGIVQSLVRLMGGEIGIVDREVGERGTCFRFNVFFSTYTNNRRELDIESNGDKFSIDSFRRSGLIVRSTQSPKTEGSQVLLFMQSSERSNVLQSFMQSLGIKVHVVKQHQQLYPALKKIKQKLINSSRAHSSRSSSSSTRSKEVPLSALDGAEDISSLPSQKRTNVRAGPVLVVIDMRAGPFREIARAVAEFRRDLNEDCYSRIVWLDKTGAGNSNFHGLDEDKLPPSDLVISKPFHGSRLYQVIRLLPEFGGGPPPRRGETSQNIEKVKHVASRSCVNENSFLDQKSEIEELGGPNSKKPLMGKKILIADDDAIGRKIATFVVSQLGADIFSCENGEEAWKLVRKGLEDGAKACGDSKDLLVPFDCILMDCEMPVMNGTEATTRIREAEEIYGVRIPIMGLTAHSKGEEIDKMIQAGVDGYLTKPLNKEAFLKAMSEMSVKI
ncbi:hypothetical protein CASFOL_003030 [Castilleja foliolosa]|uniref:histidine kinase n=1 Tax=Castilleja foliolosa TaxID=1961234 RepID=A0ABD3EJD5_9LAMI